MSLAFMLIFPLPLTKGHSIHAGVKATLSVAARAAGAAAAAALEEH